MLTCFNQLSHGFLIAKTIFLMNQCELRAVAYILLTVSLYHGQYLFSLRFFYASGVSAIKNETGKLLVISKCRDALFLNQIFKVLPCFILAPSKIFCIFCIV